MYHKLVENISDFGSYSGLLAQLKSAGYAVEDGDPGSLTDADLAEAWELFETDGPEAAVDYLETMFGFLFVER